MKVTYVDCDLAECEKRAGPLDENEEHADLAGWVRCEVAVYKLAPEEIEPAEHTQQMQAPFGMVVFHTQGRNQLEADPLHGTFCGWEHLVRWVQAEALIWQAAEAGR